MSEMERLEAAVARLERVVASREGSVRWAPARKVEEMFGIGPRVLGEMVDGGHVRRRKLKDVRQGSALYCVADIEMFMDSEEVL